MRVSDVMTTKVSTITPATPFAKIVKLLVKEKISGVPVVVRSGKVVGVISEKDLFFRLFPSEKKFYKNLEYYMNQENIEKEAGRIREFKAKKLMTKEVISVSSGDNVLTACSLFLIHRIRRLPVIDDGKLVGIVTTNDIYINYLSKFVGRRLQK